MNTTNKKYIHNGDKDDTFLKKNHGFHWDFLTKHDDNNEGANLDQEEQPYKLVLSNRACFFYAKGISHVMVLGFVASLFFFRSY